MPVTQQTASESDVKHQLSLLHEELGSLQRQARQLKIPVIILFEGADGAGKGTLINKLLMSLDPRGFKVYAMHSPNDEAIFRPFLWRFWIKTPERNKITIFDRSWYRHLLDDRVKGDVSSEEAPRYFTEINDFERQLTTDGVVLIKIYLSISKKKQSSRFEKLANNPATSWRVSKKDWKRHKQYDEYSAMADEMIFPTHTEKSPWAKIDSSSIKSATFEVLQLVRGRLTSAINEKLAEKPATMTPDLNWRAKKDNPSRLDQVDLSLTVDTEEYHVRRKQLQQRLHELEHQLYVTRRPVILVFEGWDAAGKGGAIRRLVKGLDPRGYEVIPIAAPNDFELSHHYMWRFWNQYPKGGHIAIYDRSWYGRVTVERLEGFCSEDEWKRGFEEINETEKHWHNCGAIILKFWIHISNEEQLRRFEARKNTTHKQWKISKEDWRNREKWDAYKVAIDDMIDLTDKPTAPWIVVEGNNKPYARIKVLETTVKALESVL
ncbi:MAG: polyphosphate:AMP phosphotransferase [Verrucomicrobia bacterium]|nr:polyphosphate:AMP phosphotransferase [Verrucomicrobiota bacterium]